MVVLEIERWILLRNFRIMRGTGEETLTCTASGEEDIIKTTVTDTIVAVDDNTNLKLTHSSYVIQKNSGKGKFAGTEGYMFYDGENRGKYEIFGKTNIDQTMGIPNYIASLLIGLLVFLFLFQLCWIPLRLLKLIHDLFLSLFTGLTKLLYK